MSLSVKGATTGCIASLASPCRPPISHCTSWRMRQVGEHPASAGVIAPPAKPCPAKGRARCAPTACASCGKRPAASHVARPDIGHIARARIAQCHRLHVARCFDQAVTQPLRTCICCSNQHPVDGVRGGDAAGFANVAPACGPSQRSVTSCCPRDVRICEVNGDHVHNRAPFIARRAPGNTLAPA
jgi:hypothetical protein